MNNSGNKPDAGADDPWEDLAEELFGTTFGKEHTGPAADATTGVESTGTSTTPVKRLDELLFAEADDDSGPPRAPAGVDSDPSGRDDADVAAEPQTAPQPKPATASPQDSYWDALANWSWDETEGSSALRAKARGDRGDRRDRGEREAASEPLHEPVRTEERGERRREAEVSQPAAAPIWDFDSEDETEKPATPRRRPDSERAPAASAQAAGKTDDEEDDEGEPGKRRRRRRRRRGKEEGPETPSAVPRSISHEPASGPVTNIPGADWDDSEEELPDVSPPPRTVERSQEVTRPDARREEQSRRGDSRRGGGQRDSRGERSRGGHRDEVRPEREERRPEREQRRPAREEPPVESAEIEDEAEMVERESVEPRGDGDREGRRPRRERDRGRRKSSRPEDWGEADWESVEDQVGFGTPEEELEADVSADAEPEPAVRYEDIPSWEEAISYLLQPERMPGEGGGGGRGGSSSGDSQRRGGRGGRRRR